MTKPKVRRTVSLPPQHYLLLESLSLRLETPMTQLVERMVEGLGREHDLHPMSHEAASAEILERRGNGDLRRRCSRPDYAERGRQLMAEALGA